MELSDISSRIASVKDFTSGHVNREKLLDLRNVLEESQSVLITALEDPSRYHATTQDLRSTLDETTMLLSEVEISLSEASDDVSTYLVRNISPDLNLDHLLSKLDYKVDRERIYAHLRMNSSALQLSHEFFNSPSPEIAIAYYLLYRQDFSLWLLTKLSQRVINGWHIQIPVFAQLYWATAQNGSEIEHRKVLLESYPSLASKFNQAV